jgi:nicotinate-nucleotide--dimethylbenzimidazole phosphoribosyltransferase
MHALTAVSAEDCVGRGTGVDDAALRRKADVVAAAVARHGRDGTPLDMLARYGGFEIAMMCGAMLGAAARRQIVIVDGFIATAAAAVAAAIAPQLLDYCVFAHVSAEAPHRRWLQALGARPLLDLGLRLGEGSGAVLALPLLRAAAAVLSEMATFASAGVSGRSDVPPNESPHESAHEGMNEGTNQGADA